MIEPELLGGWQIFRQRTDKTANAIKTAESIIKTIMNPVYEDELKDLLEDLQNVTFAGETAVVPEEKTVAKISTELGKRTH